MIPRSREIGEKNFDPVPSLMLCLVKGPVGALYDVVPRLFGDLVVRRTDPAADSQDFEWVRLVGNTAVCNALDKSSRHGVSVLSRRVRQQHEYFFPAIPVNAIRFPNGFFKKTADLLQDSVPCCMAVVIVVELEIVDVQKNNRIGTPIPGGGRVGVMRSTSMERRFPILSRPSSNERSRSFLFASSSFSVRLATSTRESPYTYR